MFNREKQIISSPCKDCSDKVLNCHSNCEMYKKYRKELDNFNSMIRAAKTVNNTYRNAISSTVLYQWRRNNKKGKTQGLR